MYSGERTLKNLCSVFKVKSFSSFLENMSKNLGLTSIEDLLSRVGRGDFPMSQLIDCMDQKHGSFYEYSLRLGNFLKLYLVKLGIPLFRRAHFTYDQVELARCCNPVPGDSIIGCFSVGLDFVVHRIECPDLKKLPAGSKIIAVKVTNHEKGTKYLSYLKIAFFKKEASFTDASSIMSKFGANVYNMRTDEFFTELVYMIKVHNVQEIDEIISCVNTKHWAFRINRILAND
jgi:(p)ppGpp synthase/HD superfamily hydrolase